jgi:copper chaperone
MPSTHEYAVEGMTCEHCKASVTEKVSAIPGAEDVQVDLETGRLRVTGDVEYAAVNAAVDEAGYRLA